MEGTMKWALSYCLNKNGWCWLCTHFTNNEQSFMIMWLPLSVTPKSGCTQYRVPQGQMSKLNKHTYFTGFEFQFEFITIPTLCWAVQVGQGNSYLRGVHEMTHWGRGSNVWFMFTFAVLLKVRFSLHFLKDNFWYSGIFIPCTNKWAHNGCSC